jgi:hypothetical protein
VELRLRLGDKARDELGRRAIRERRTPHGEAEILLLAALGLRPGGESMRQAQFLKAPWMARRLLNTVSDQHSPSTFRRSVSLHESAHAVIAVLAGVDVADMSLTRDAWANGETRTWVTGNSAEDIHARFRLSIAGLAMDAIDDQPLVSEGDLASANSLAAELQLSRAEFDSEVDDVRATLIENRRAVEELARELDDRGSLTGEQVVDILRVNGVS